MNILLVKCRTCEEEKEVSNFYKSSINKSGYVTECKECYRKRTSVNNIKHKDRHLMRSWKSQLKRRYKCTPEEYTERMNTSDTCEVCGVTEDLVYDHCHTTGEFRGVLCRGCNRSIGQLGDTAASLYAAFTYLQSKEILW